MSLQLGQLIYTSFAGTGFTSLTSPEVPKNVEQAFLEQMVYQNWDCYNPPASEYRAAYLHQLTLEDTLFGWLYNNGIDEFGRYNVPYFIFYYLTGQLQTTQLENIFMCLQNGPITLIDRQNVQSTLQTIAIPEGCSYQSASVGVVIPPVIQEQSFIRLQHRKLINLAVPDDTMKHGTNQNQPSDRNLEGSGEYLIHDQPVSAGSHANEQTMYTDKIEAILRELAAKPIGIHGAVLVSSQGQLITAPFGIDGACAQQIAKTMLYVAKNTHEEFNWAKINNIVVRGQDGHVILTLCSHGTFLLVKAGKTVTGLLEGEINRTAKKLQTALTFCNDANTVIESVDE